MSEENFRVYKLANKEVKKGCEQRLGVSLIIRCMLN